MVESVSKLAGKVFDAVVAGTAAASGIAVIAILALVAANAVSRYLFKLPIVGTMEITAMLLVVAGFLALARTMREGGHVRVSMLADALPLRAQGVLRAIGLVILLVLLVEVTRQSIDQVFFSRLVGKNSMGELSLPYWIPQLVMPLGLALLLVQTAVMFVAEVRAVVSGIPTVKPQGHAVEEKEHEAVGAGSSHAADLSARRGVD